MAFGLSFQPGAQLTPDQSRSTSAALGPGQKALKILALHLPQIGNANRGTSAPRGVGQSPEAVTFQSLVQALSDHPIGGLPTTGPLVGAFGNLPPEHTPTSLIGEDGEWQPGRDELAPPVPDGRGIGGDGTMDFASLMSRLR